MLERAHTRAISSDFLNSPSTTVTLPLSSSSVQRSFSSLGLLTRPSRVDPSFQKGDDGSSRGGLSGHSRCLCFHLVASSHHGAPDDHR